MRRQQREDHKAQDGSNGTVSYAPPRTAARPEARKKRGRMPPSVSEAPGPADTLLSDFFPPELWGTSSLPAPHSVGLRHATLGNEHTP